MGTVEGRDHLMGKGRIWPVGSDGDRLAREVYARFGLAAYHAQVLEAGMIQALVVLRMLPRMRNFTDRIEWEKAFDEFTTRQEGLTFGNLAKALREHDDMPDAVRDALDASKVDRDFMIHHFFRVRAPDLMSQEGKRRMLIDLENYAVGFMKADDLLDDWILPIGAAHGLDKEKMNAEVEEMIERARGRSS